MGTLWGEALSSINAYVKKLAEDKVETEVTLVAFDDHAGLQFDMLRGNVKPSEWKDLTPADAVPRGSTPLNDATGRIVARAMADNPDRAAIIIMTDGHENASRELTVEQAKKLLDDCRAKGWQVVFLGANFDNKMQAASYGTAVGQTVSLSPQNLKAGLVATASMRSAYGASGQAMAYSDEDRRKFSSDKAS